MLVDSISMPNNNEHSKKDKRVVEICCKKSCLKLVELRVYSVVRRIDIKKSLKQLKDDIRHQNNPNSHIERPLDSQSSVLQNHRSHHPNNSLKHANDTSQRHLHDQQRSRDFDLVVDLGADALDDYRKTQRQHEVHCLQVQGSFVKLLLLRSECFKSLQEIQV